MIRKFMGIFCALLVLSGCAAKGKFVYEPSLNPAEGAQGRKVAVLAPLADERIEKQQFDRFYDGEPIKDLQPILEKELLSTNLFSEVFTATESNQNAKADIMIEPAIEKLEWAVPDYEALLSKAFFISFLTGGIGGVIYGNTDTDVYGNATIRVRVTDKQMGNVLLNKSYNGHHEEQMIKFKCDIPETRVKMANESLKKAIGSMNADLKDVISTLK